MYKGFHSFTLFSNRTVTLDRFTMNKTIEQSVTIDENTLGLISGFKLKDIYKSVIDMFWHSDLPQTCSDVYINGQKVLSFYCGGIWNSCDLEKTKDITGIIRKGKNDIKINVYKCPPFVDIVTVKIYDLFLNVYYEYDFEPDIKIDRYHTFIKALGWTYLEGESFTVNKGVPLELHMVVNNGESESYRIGLQWWDLLSNKGVAWTEANIKPKGTYTWNYNIVAERKMKLKAVVYVKTSSGWKQVDSLGC